MWTQPCILKLSQMRRENVKTCVWWHKFFTRFYAQTKKFIAWWRKKIVGIFFKKHDVQIKHCDFYVLCLFLTNTFFLPFRQKWFLSNYSLENKSWRLKILKMFAWIFHLLMKDFCGSYFRETWNPLIKTVYSWKSCKLYHNLNTQSFSPKRSIFDVKQLLKLIQWFRYPWTQ